MSAQGASVTRNSPRSRRRGRRSASGSTAIFNSRLVAWLGSLTLCLSVFSGNFTRIIPVIPVDRLCTVLFLIAAIRISWTDRPVLRPIHAVLIAQILWVAGSAVAAATLTQGAGFYALIDQVVVPSALFTVAPVVFRSEQDRVLLLRCIAVTCVYVGMVSSAQSLGLSSFVFPRYIAQASVPGEITRAVGPSLQAASNGAMLTMCIAPILMLFAQSRSGWRIVSIVALIATILGSFLSLTRSVWAGGLIAFVIYAVLDPRARRVAFGIASGAALAAVTAFSLIPSLAAVVGARASTVRSLDDRSTTNIAAIQMFDVHPLFGVGWARFLDNVDSYVRQQDLVPLTTTHIPAHNIFLSRAAELGFLGVVLFVMSLALGPARSIVVAWISGRRDWATVLACMLAAWFSVAMLTPMGYTFPNYFLWLIAGVLAAPAGARVGAFPPAGTHSPAPSPEGL